MSGFDPNDAGNDGLPRSPKTEPSTLLKARLLLAVSQLPAPSRQVVIRQTLMLTVGSWAVAVAVFLYAGGVRVTGRPVSLVIGTAVGTAAAASVACWAALGRGSSTLGRARRLVLPIVVAAPLVILGWKIFWSAHYEEAFRSWSTRPGFRCLVLTLAMAIGPLVAFLVARRGTDARRPTLTGFAAGLAVGCATSFLTDLWCPVAYVPHLLLGHLLPTIVLGAVGAALGRLVLGIRTE